MNFSAKYPTVLFILVANVFEVFFTHVFAKEIYWNAQL